MRIVAQTSRAIRSQLAAHVAWMPLANIFELGDFGLVRGGIFGKVGNISELGVTFTRKTKPGTRFEFRSEGTVEVRLSGDAEVNVHAAGDVGASLKFLFSDEKSVLLRAKSVELQEMDDLLAVARALHVHPRWRWNYRVVRKIWLAEHGVFIATGAAGANIEFTGAISALEQLYLGNASGEISVKCATNVGLSLVNQSGPLALGLFRVRLRGDPALIDFGSPGVQPPAFSVDTDEDWEDDASDE